MSESSMSRTLSAARSFVRKHQKLDRSFYVRVGPNDEDTKDLTDVVHILHGPTRMSTAEDFNREWWECFEIERVNDEYTVNDIWDRMKERGWIGNNLEIATDVEY
jgi:hypothetical protein